MKYPKPSQYKYAKSQYRVRNWPGYEAGLKKRGDLTVWIAGDALNAWRKLHLAVDAETGEIVWSDLTARRTHDCTPVPTLLEQLDDPIEPLSADGAYDTKAVYEAAHERGEGRAVRVLIPPGRDAQLNSDPSVAQQERNRNIRSIREFGRRGWHTSSGYSKRSLVENTMY